MGGGWDTSETYHGDSHADGDDHDHGDDNANNDDADAKKLT